MNPKKRLVSFGRGAPQQAMAILAGGSLGCMQRIVILLLLRPATTSAPPATLDDCMLAATPECDDDTALLHCIMTADHYYHNLSQGEYEMIRTATCAKDAIEK